MEVSERDIALGRVKVPGLRHTTPVQARVNDLLLQAIHAEADLLGMPLHRWIVAALYDATSTAARLKALKAVGLDSVEPK